VIPISTVLLALLMGCTVDQQPDQGVFVGNPGKLELTAARTHDYQLGGSILLQELVLGACGSDQSITAPLEDRELALVDDGALRFELDEPLQVPPGAWCRLELVLSSANLTADGMGEDGQERTFQLEFEGISIAVSGAEFVIDDQLLALELGESDWLTPLRDVPTDDPDQTDIDLAQAAPQTHAALRVALEQRSALYLLDVGDAEDIDQTPPAAANGESPLWSGDGREPDPTEPTDTGGPTDTGIVEPPQVDLQIDLEQPLQGEVLAVGTPVYVGPMVYVPVATLDFGSAVVTTLDYGYDPADQQIQPQATDAALTTDGQQLFLLSTTPSGAAIDTLEVDAMVSMGTTPFPGSPREPEAGVLASGPVATWLDGDQLVFTYAMDDQATLLAEGVLDYDLATDGGEGMLLSWLEPVSNPLAPAGGTAQFTAYLAEDRTVLFEGAAATEGLAIPKAALFGERAVVARIEGGAIVAKVFGVDGIEQVPLGVDAQGVEAFDMAMLGDVVMMAWSGVDGLQLQLFDAISGASITEPVPVGEVGDAGAEEVAIALQDEGLLRFTVAFHGQNQAAVVHGWSEEALLR